ncbi:Uncharacterized protein FWK35_00023368, partial [Aphis craccivora]
MFMNQANVGTTAVHFDWETIMNYWEFHLIKVQTRINLISETILKIVLNLELILKFIKIQKAIINGRMIHCINAKPYIYSDLMVTLDDLIQMLLPLCTVARCADVFKRYLLLTICRGRVAGEQKSQFDIREKHTNGHASRYHARAVLRLVLSLILLRTPMVYLA